MGMGWGKYGGLRGGKRDGGTYCGKLTSISEDIVGGEVGFVDVVDWVVG